MVMTAIVLPAGVVLQTANFGGRVLCRKISATRTVRHVRANEIGVSAAAGDCRLLATNVRRFGRFHRRRLTQLANCRRCVGPTLVPSGLFIGNRRILVAIPGAVRILRKVESIADAC